MSGRYADEVRPLNLEQQKTRAKELRRDLERGVPEAIDRFRVLHPKSTGLSDAQIIARLAKVTEAQVVIARELGLPGWAQLRRHILRLNSAREEVEAGAAVLDGDLTTLHIRCGTDIQQDLTRAGLGGKFLEYSDPFCQGPVPRDGNLAEIRARFLSDAYDMPVERMREDLARAALGLEKSITTERVVLWFEHDTYDQLILARLLAFYTEHGTPPRLELVHIDRFPGVPRFRGLGELSPGALRMLWADRVRVGAPLLSLGSSVWEALREPAPTMLHDVAGSSDALPQMGIAVRRHLRELPWQRDGLGLTQHHALELLADGAETIGQVFVQFTSEREPLGLGDSMFFAILRDMLRASPAPIEITGDDQPMWQRRIRITDAGRRILAGSLDYLSCNPPERWVGGVRIGAGAADWRWDESRGRPNRE